MILKSLMPWAIDAGIKFKTMHKSGRKRKILLRILKLKSLKKSPQSYASEKILLIDAGRIDRLGKSHL